MGTPLVTPWDQQKGAHVSDGIVAVLPPRAASAAEARELVTTQCVQWGFANLCDDVALVVTELVANAVRHAGTDIRITLTQLEHGVRLEVRDGSTRPLRPRAALSSDEGGRGLLLVDALSNRYGVLGEPDGKRVWVELQPA
jgi:anti-sigma regulatory factor (Ser/Thr protein kinase)